MNCRRELVRRPAQRHPEVLKERVAPAATDRDETTRMLLSHLRPARKGRMDCGLVEHFGSPFTAVVEAAMLHALSGHTERRGRVARACGCATPYSPAPQ